MGLFACPSCRTTLAVLNQPCYNCGLMFIQGSVECPACHLPESNHLRKCPPKDQPRLTCPLCGGKRHRHEKAASVRECLWQQCFGELVPETQENLLHYAEWIKTNGTNPAGYWESEKELRRRGLL